MPSSSVAQAQSCEPNEQDIRTKPWKYVGYRGYSEFIASDDDLLVFRRFSVLNARVLLSLQDKVCELEKELLELDKAYSGKNTDDFNNGTFREDLPDRAELLEVIAIALPRYNDLVLQQSALRKYPTAPRRDIKNIANWHYNHGDQAIANEERQYIQHTSDLISITEKDKTPLRQFIDSSRWLRTLPIWRQLSRSGDNTTPQHDSDGDVSYYSDKRINKFTSLAIVLIGIAMLLTPIWILQALQSPTAKLVVITVFILVFLITLSYAMVTKPFEALGAAAAYAAVLMVFLQVGGSD
ncbi:phytase [Apiospora sp. TS-2023a]